MPGSYVNAFGLESHQKREAKEDKDDPEGSGKAGLMGESWKSPG